MYLRSTTVKSKGGKTYRYWKLVESVNTEKGPRQRVIAHLGDLTSFGPEDWQELADRMGAPEMVSKLQRRVRQGGRKGRPPGWTLDDHMQKGETVTVRLDSIRLKNPRDFGDVYVGLQIWKHLGLGKLMAQLFEEETTGVPVPLMAAFIAVNRLVCPMSELRMVRWFPQTALPSLLGISSGVVNEDRLYRTLDQVFKHKERIEKHLSEKGLELFNRDYMYLLYDLTSTYFEGQGMGNPKAKRGHSRDKRPDCLQICIGVVVDREGFPVGYEVLSGNVRDSETVLPMLQRLEERFGKADNERLLCMDRGMISETNLEELRSRKYIMADRRSEARQWWEKIDEGNWQAVRKSRSGEIMVEVQEVGEEDGDRILLVRSKGCGEKERGIHERFLSRLIGDLCRLVKLVEKGRLKDPVKIERKIGAILSRYPGVNNWVRVDYSREHKKVCWWVKPDVKELAEELEGIYVLRTNTTSLPAKEIWEYYIRLTEVENVFRTLKHDLDIRPVFHRKEERVEAHVLFSFLAYAMMWTLEHLHRNKGGTLTGRRLLEYLHCIKMGTVVMETRAGFRLNLERVCDLTRQQQEVLETLGVSIPRIRTKLEAISLHL